MHEEFFTDSPQSSREPTCPRCLRVISIDDIVEFDGAHVVHIDCRRPRDLTRDERTLVYGYCWAHPIACPACAQSVRLFELDPDPFGHHKRTTGCPGCQADLTETVRDHLYTCSLSPEIVRRRAREVRETARTLVKRAQELRDQADVLMREAEVTAAELRDAMTQSTAEALRHFIQVKLRDGSLPHDNIPATIPGGPGDGSICGACDQPIPRQTLMMVVPHGTRPIPLHANCFEIWNEERRTFTSNA